MARNIKGIVMLCGLLSAAPSAQAQASSPPPEEAKADRYYQFTMYHYCFTLIFRGETFKDRVEKNYPDTITCYEAYIRNHPQSPFLDDAKLRIAEVYNLSAGRSGEREQFPYIRFNDGWLPMANKWLHEVVLQHAHDKRFDRSKARDLDEPPSALALWYLGTWNRNIAYLKRLVDEYPQSEPAAWVLERLRKIEEDAERKKTPNPP